MRHLATILLAPYLGQTLTPELAKEILAKFPAEGDPIDLAQFKPKKCGALTFAVERARDILGELEPLHEEHWWETEQYRDHRQLKPDIASGLLDEQCGRMIQFTARNFTGQLVGNIRMYVGSRSRHTGLPVATEDTVYLHRDYRGGIYGLRFVQYMEQCIAQLSEEDTEVYMDDKLANPSAGRLLEFQGYQHIANRRYKILRGTRHVRSDS